ncbi:unnamed protein product [Vicia faba]|uniref:Transposase MuDR plant domain-containing protein n=1 Tax=Vicia faba TaxID=3906 RepID=A0AAV1AT56_VICFA|nr:unnamed protein product [Vicia faba]
MIRDDGDASELAVYVVGNNCEVEIFSEPKLVTREAAFMNMVKEKGNGKICDEDDGKLSECSGDSSDEYVMGVHFDDSEEEGMKGFDEGVDVGVDGEPRTKIVANSDASNELVKNMFIIEEMGKERVIEEDYMTDELDSGADDDSCVKSLCVIKFNKEDALSKDFTSKVGMEFSSLKQFKHDMLEHNVLNGRDVRIKATFAKHECGSQFFNKNAKAEWVAKVIVDGWKNNTNKKLNEVVADVRLRYSTEIPYCRAFKERKISCRRIFSPFFLYTFINITSLCNIVILYE